MNQNDEKRKEAVNVFPDHLGRLLDIKKIKPAKSSDNGWISVDDFLPKKDGKYLVYYGRLKGARSKYAIEYFSFYNERFDFNNILITHWLPLPEPPVCTRGSHEQILY